MGIWYVIEVVLKIRGEKKGYLVIDVGIVSRLDGNNLIGFILYIIRWI